MGKFLTAHINMKKIIIITILSSLFSCSNRNMDKPKQTKSTETLVSSNLDNINNSQYSVVKFQIDNKLCFATINQFFKNYKNKNSFPFSLWVTVETLDKNENGHPVDSEALLYNNLEDSLIGHFISKTPFCFIGRTTRDGYREIMFYVSDKVKVTEIMNAFIKENQFKRKIEFAVDPDPTWESVRGFY